MDETQALYRQVFQTANEQTLLVDGTSRAGIEAALVSLIEPGDRVLVPIFGRFGHLLRRDRRALRRRGARDRGAVGAGLRRRARSRPPSARSSRSCSRSCTATPRPPWRSPSTSSARSAREHGVLFYTDVTASLGGNDFRTDELGLDAVTAGLQKCLGGPSGSAPVTFSDARRRGDHVPQVGRGGHPRARATRSRADRDPLELLRPRHDLRLLGPAAAQPPHRGDLDALRRPRVRPAPGRRGHRRTPSPATRLHGDAMLAGRAGASASTSSATSRTR